jgi:alanine-synthesizing transaminase
MPSKIIPSKRMDQLPYYLFGKLNAEKQRLRELGRDIIDFGMGNPDMPASREIVQKTHDVIDDEKAHRYSRATGIPHLLNAVAEHYRTSYRVELDPETEVIATIGSKEGLSHLALALLGPGDVCAVPEPYFPVHMWSVVIAGASVVNIPITDKAEELINSLDRLEAKPKVIFLNYPHNPTGTTVEHSFFEETVPYFRKHNIIVIHDFAYKDITFGAYKAPSILQVEGAKEIAVEFFTMSKSYNMAGWRCGFCLGNTEMVHLLSRIKSFFDYGMFTPIQVAAITALKGDPENVSKIAAKYENRRNVLIEGLARSGWNIPKNRGAMFVWSSMPESFREMGSLKFAECLLEEADVLVSPGIGFGSAGEGFIRMSLVENTHRIRQAVRQMNRLLKG